MQLREIGRPHRELVDVPCRRALSAACTSPITQFAAAFPSPDARATALEVIGERPGRGQLLDLVGASLYSVDEALLSHPAEARESSP